VKLSIVSTLYQSAATLEEFCARSSGAARRAADDDYEIVLVNDGSTDETLQVAVRLCEADPHLVVVDLSRNFGQHKAMMTAIAHARGSLVYLLDSDLEEDPEWLEPFAAQMARERCDVVYGMQQTRKGGLFERWSGHWFYRGLTALTGMPLPHNVVTARLMSRRYVDALVAHDEREVFMAGLWHITGFDQRPQAVSKRSKETSTYTLRRKLALLVNSVTSFSNAPLIGIFYVGVAISIIAGAYAVYLVLNWLFLSRPLSGWTSVMASIWLLGGLVISFIGVIGIYLSKIFSETKRRPYTIVRHVYGNRDVRPAE
jgi:putative glycosyltransferase